MPHLRRSSAGRGGSRGRGGLRARASEGKEGRAVSERHSIASVTILRRLSPSLWLWRPGRSEANLESCADVPRGRLPLRPRIGPTNPLWGLPLVAGSVSCPKLRPGLVESWRGGVFLVSESSEAPNGVLALAVLWTCEFPSGPPSSFSFRSPWGHACGLPELVEAARWILAFSGPGRFRGPVRETVGPRSSFAFVWHSPGSSNPGSLGLEKLLFRPSGLEVPMTKELSTRVLQFYVRERGQVCPAGCCFFF